MIAKGCNKKILDAPMVLNPDQVSRDLSQKKKHSLMKCLKTSKGVLGKGSHVGRDLKSKVKSQGLGNGSCLVSAVDQVRGGSTLNQSGSDKA
jgi:hypothetical protein